jgi:hypothetical protein
MLPHFMPGLVDIHGVFNVFIYISFRAAGASSPRSLSRSPSAPS